MTPPKRNMFNNPHPNSIAYRVKTGQNPKLKAALKAWEDERIEDAKAMERWYHSLTRRA